MTSEKRSTERTAGKGRKAKFREVRCSECKDVYLMPVAQRRLKSYEHCPYCEARRFRAVKR